MTNPYVVDFRKAANAADLATFIGIPRNLFEAVVSARDRSEFYKRHLIPKRSPYRAGEYRIVWECSTDVLADGHKAFARRFEVFVRDVESRYPHQAAYGYVRNRGIRDNAQQHCKAPVILRSDLKNFFPSISIAWLEREFLRLGLEREAASILSRFATIDGKLALGLHASPLLANLVALPLDDRLRQLALRHACQYTRYADDLAFSGTSVPTVGEAATEIETEGFTLNGRKTRTTRLGQAHYITGLSVSDSQPHVPRFFKRKLRQEIFYCKKYGILNHLGHVSELSHRYGINRLEGSVRYLASIEPALGKRIMTEWKTLLNASGLTVVYVPRPSTETHKIKLFIDETEIEFNDKKYLAVACVVIEETDLIARETTALLQQFIKDPFSTGRKSSIEKKGIHFSDAPEDLRTAFIIKLANFLFRAYVAYAEQTGNYEDLYLRLIDGIIQRRLIAYDRSDMEIICEENDKVKISAIISTVQKRYELLEKIGNRRPMDLPKVRFGSKVDDLCLSVPDFILGVFSKFATLKIEDENKRAIWVKRFERLRDKYRLIVDHDKGRGFSRRQAFQSW